MHVREYRPSDCEDMVRLFRDTVKRVNSRDYDPVQIRVWAKRADPKKWNPSFMSHRSLVAVMDDEIVGFGDIDEDGYLDRLYVSADHQGEGIGTALCDELEKGFSAITTHASITALPFFQKRGYMVIREQQVILDDIPLTNYVMQKRKPF